MELGAAQELAVIFPVLRERWDSMDRVFQDALAKESVLDAAGKRGEVLETSYDGYRVSHEAEIGGFRLNEDEEGNPLPEMVVVRSTIWVIPNEKEQGNF